MRKPFFLLPAFLTLFCSTGIAASETWSDFGSIEELMVYLWEDFESDGRFPENLPDEKDLKSLEIFSPERFDNLDPASAWREAEGMKILELAYSFRRDRYSHDLAVMFEIQTAARARVLDRAMKNTYIRDCTIDVSGNDIDLLMEFGLGLDYLGGYIVTNYREHDVEDLRILVKLMVDNGLKYYDRFYPEILESLNYFIPYLLDMGLDGEIDSMLNRYIDETAG